VIARHAHPMTPLDLLRSRLPVAAVVKLLFVIVVF
jgi:hypothetical protein